GPGSSPILWRDLLIVHCDGSDVQFIVALDKRDGHVVWKTLRTGKLESNPQFKKAYGTPLVVEIGGEDVLISPAANWLYGYQAATGRELWKVSYETLGFSNVPRPVLGNNRLFICTGFMKSELLAIDFDPRQGEVAPLIAWRFGKQVPQIPSPLLIDNDLYFVSDQGGVFTCLDADSGAMVYRERLGGNHAASPLLADGRIYLCDRAGTTHVIQPGRTFRLLATNRLKDGCMASPAAVAEGIYLRTTTALYRLSRGTDRTAERVDPRLR
ncbi:MAG TPA: PQQ-binding-like beta-propeller repeat protein, partial [Pirellulaceae bacterium]